ncbi:ena/VASP-like protein [Colletes gigas]|uniref:ena/VASP-like protein n=1 Tax=Colletes gigas TaxID=935657 RepID=UPI001C9ACC4A|nr:ena/VASP-like protein [Colletes gigas]
MKRFILLAGIATLLVFSVTEISAGEVSTEAPTPQVLAVRGKRSPQDLPPCPPPPNGEPPRGPPPDGAPPCMPPSNMAQLASAGEAMMSSMGRMKRSAHDRLLDHQDGQGGQGGNGRDKNMDDNLPNPMGGGGGHHMG